MITSGHQLLSAWTSCFNHRHKRYTTIHAQSCQPDTERHSASSCHVCWDAVFYTYFVVIECVDWNKFVWIKVLFLENHISYLLYLSRTGMHFGDTWNKCPTLCLLCLYIISIMFDVLADHRKNFTHSDVSCRVTNRAKHFLISLQIFLLL